MLRAVVRAVVLDARAFWLWLAAILAVSTVVHSLIPMNDDVAWFVWCARVLLRGGVVSALDTSGRTGENDLWHGRPRLGAAMMRISPRRFSTCA